MNIHLLSALVICVGCSTPPAVSPETQTEAACVAIDRSYGAAANGVIDSGVCDKYARIQDCPPYLAIEELYDAVLGALQCPG